MHDLKKNDSKEKQKKFAQLLKEFKEKNQVRPNSMLKFLIKPMYREKLR